MRVLRLDPDAPRGTLRGAHEAASRSILISATRCLVTYVLLPILGPAVGLAGVAGPILGLVLSAVSIVAIVYAARRFFDGDHRLRWPYAVVGGGIIVLLVVQSILDVKSLLG
jgi:F0F1-type ATP synthase assembly protein I